MGAFSAHDYLTSKQNKILYFDESTGHYPFHTRPATFRIVAMAIACTFKSTYDDRSHFPIVFIPYVGKIHMFYDDNSFINTVSERNGIQIIKKVTTLFLESSSK